MTNFQLKILAIIFMTIDHVAFLLISDPSLRLYMRMVGRLSFPIFLFLVLEGYKYTSNKTNYIKRLYGFALISILPFYLCFGVIFNVFFTLGSVVLMLYIFEKYSNCAYNYIIFFTFTYATFQFDWGLPAIFTVFFLRNKIYDTKKLATTLPILLTISVTIYYSIIDTVNLFTLPFILPILCTIPILHSYNGELGLKLSGYKKYFLYIYYPLHLLILGFLFRYINL